MPSSTAEELILNLLYPLNEGWPVGKDGRPKVPSGLDVGIAGAYLLDLAIAGCVEMRGDCVVARPGGTHPDPDLASWLRHIAAGQRRSVSWWIERIAGESPHLRQIERLRARNLVGEYDQPTRGWFRTRNVRRCFALDWGPLDLTTSQLLKAVNAEVTDARTEGLLAILCAGGWHHWISSANPEGKRRAELMSRSHWIGREVAHILVTRSIPFV